jgi:hypothetical protein
MSFGKTTSATRNPVSGKAAPAQAVAPSSPKGTMPTHNVSVKIGDGDLLKLTGLFANESKTGTAYLSGKTREDITIPAGSTFFIFENTPKN